MSTHIADDLPLLLTGEATRDEVLVAATHLRTCEDCRNELVSAVVAHASLTSARRFAPEIMATLADSAAVLPNLDAVFEQAHADARRPQSRRRNALVAAAIAACLVGGGTATYLAARSTTSSSPAARTVALAPYGDGAVPASARLTGGNHLSITATSLPRLDTTRRYEVWLTNAARSAMQPVGWIGEDGRASITVPRSLMSTYTDIEVSVQQLDAPYAYSGLSVLRGAYA